MLAADMVYVQQSAARIMRAIFEICVKRGWAQLSHKLLDLCNMIQRRMWLSQTPLRQFKGDFELKTDIIRKIEKKDVPWERYYDLSPQDLGELMQLPKLGKRLHRLIHLFPKVA